MGFEKQDLDFALVPAGLLLLSSYHAWLLYRIKRYPTTTVIGLNALNREIWVDTMMAVSQFPHIPNWFGLLDYMVGS